MDSSWTYFTSKPTYPSIGNPLGPRNSCYPFGSYKRHIYHKNQPKTNRKNTNPRKYPKKKMNQGFASTVDMSFILTQMAKTNEMVMRLTENIGQLSGVSLRLDEAIEENERLKQTMTQQKEMLWK